MKKLGRKKINRYSPDFRRKVVSSILEGQLGVCQAATRYGISRMSIYRWLDALENNTDQLKKQKSKGAKAKEQSKKGDLSEEVSRLQEALRMERLRSQAYQEMIKQAETYFNISIEKKSGSKQSKK